MGTNVKLDEAQVGGEIMMIDWTGDIQSEGVDECLWFL